MTGQARRLSSDVIMNLGVVPVWWQARSSKPLWRLVALGGFDSYPFPPFLGFSFQASGFRVGRATVNDPALKEATLVAVL